MKTDKTLKSTVKNGLFTKEDLKFGDIVTVRNGYKYIYIPQKNKFFNSDGIGFMHFNDFNDLLESIGTNALDIMRVQRYIHYSQYGDTIYTLTTLYERKEVTLTPEEKEYLENIINGYNKEIEYIIKDNQEFKLILKNYCSFYPIIHIDLLKYKFKGINNGRYTLKELGL